jgi:hypothetical protein
MFAWLITRGSQPRIARKGFSQMLSTFRGPLVAGTIAALGASTLAAVPAGHPVARSTAQVALTAFDNPVEQLLATAQMGQNYLFGVYYNGGDIPTPGAGEANWTSAGFDQTGGDLLNYLLYNEASLGFYSFVGLSPNSTANAGPILRALQTNWSDYVNVGLTGVITATSALAAGVWDYPSALLTAAQLALQGQIPEALSVLTDAVFGPITAAGEAMLSAGTYVLGNVVAKVGAVLASLPQIFTTFAGTAIGGAALLAEKSAQIATEWVGNLAALNFEGAWNVAVDGLFGPSGLPGTTLNLTTGAGVQTGPILNPETDVPGNFVPSWRTSFQAAVWSIADALQTTPAPTAATPVAAARVGKPAAARSAAAIVDAPESPSAATSATSDAGAGSDSAARSAKAAASDRSAATRDRSARSGADRAGD